MLQGIRVIDLTSHLSGPYCTWLLGTLGADVIKVERPEGDPARSVGPHVEGESLYFCSINRNKRSITLDLKVPKDADVLRGLIAKADVLVENMKPGALARLGFSDEAISQLNPGLIYASISGFGQTGPLSARPAFDIIVQAMSGMISITGPKEGSPVRVGASIGDIGAALFATIDIVAALFARERNTGRRRLDISMLDCQLALLENAIARYLNTGQVPRPLGTRDPSIVPFQAFATSDGLVAVAAEGNGMWKALCEAIDAPHLIVDPRFDNAEARLANHGQLEPILADILRGRITAEWVECLSRAGIPVGPVNTIGGAMAEPQVKERRMVSHLRDAGNNGLDFVACPIGERRQDRPAPQLGAQSDEIRAMALGK
ncbi:MAG: CaiB/BaiF CoA transferase family protein [Hyphomicrobiaceae bacterium]